tara:strand:+ start:305 stop:1024 length:720 start_codon:yes stop_codon:yes gene_type:complete
MKSHQRIIREKKTKEVNLLLFKNRPNIINLKKTIVKPINFKTAEKIILEYEWIGTMPLPKSCRFMFGIYFDGVCGGVSVFVEPSTRQFNKNHPRQAVQLNRGACVHWTPKNTASKLISQSLKLLKKQNIKIITAYCTREAGEYGTIYQSLSWDYVGKTQPSYSYWLDNHWIAERTLADKKKWAKNKSQEWKDYFNNLPKRKLKGKFKYVKLLGTKKENKEIKTLYNFYAKPYPKRNNAT